MADFEEADYANDNLSDNDSESPSPSRRRRSPSIERVGEDDSRPEQLEVQELHVIRDYSPVCPPRARSAAIETLDWSLDLGPIARGSVGDLLSGRLTSPGMPRAVSQEVVKSKPRPPYKAFPGKKPASLRVPSDAAKIAPATSSGDTGKIAKPDSSGTSAVALTEDAQSSSIVTHESELQSSKISDCSNDLRATSVEVVTNESESGNMKASSSEVLVERLASNPSEKEHDSTYIKDMSGEKILERPASNPSEKENESTVTKDSSAEEVAERPASNPSDLHVAVDLSESDEEDDLAPDNRSADEESAIPEDSAEKLHDLKCHDVDTVNGVRTEEPPDLVGEQVNDVNDDARISFEEQTLNTSKSEALVGSQEPHSMADDVSASKDTGNELPAGQIEEKALSGDVEHTDASNNEDDDECMILEVSLSPAALHVPSKEEIAEAQRLETMRRVVSLAPCETDDDHERLAARAARFGTPAAAVEAKTAMGNGKSPNKHLLDTSLDELRRLQKNELQSEDDLAPLPEVILFKDKPPSPKLARHGTGFLSTLLSEPILSHSVFVTPHKAVPASHISSSPDSTTPAVPKAKKMPRIQKKTIAESNGSIATISATESKINSAEPGGNIATLLATESKISTEEPNGSLELKASALESDGNIGKKTAAVTKNTVSISALVKSMKASQGSAPTQMTPVAAASGSSQWQSNSRAPSEPRDCWLWTKFGKCKYGTTCKFAHSNAGDTHKQLLHMRRKLGDIDLVPDWKRFKANEDAAPRRAPNFGLREECGQDLPLFNEDADLGAYIDTSLLKVDVESAEPNQEETAEVDPYLDIEVPTEMEQEDDLGEARAAAFRLAFEELPEAAYTS